ncbi:radical SAM family heme chaperone HemW [Paenactinomyces guangxiensis]|uniref:Heme chaperone HemW n=1 Tax=Paenactinomyces guangxiensis TaxID=1490290 RepID=A0A7W1WNR7_9BACL|nr:radical SAM family heme chaperone HemW [Paenactinomyces guangxiensis]MBA4493124.1 oxygen-independent coproporphyrinogen III oxidase [Paenactinomyces guangxiensis]MBH8590026.1 oxygen-independent coproporphyrinogen III oxidase [Paenactinomyces guangxiensis]
MAPKAIYIHIPFCTNKCHYCDFTAYVVNGQPVDEYLEALEREMAMTVQEVSPREIQAIFIGGGTPTVLTPEQMRKLLNRISRYFPDWTADLEFTVEANPGTTGPELLQVMREGGVNRISFGAQTFRPDLLQKIGRIHGVEDIERSVDQAREAGFDNLSLDLMFGLPEQTVEDMEEALEKAVSLGPDHFSCYSLKVEEGTLFHRLYERKELPLPSEDEELEMYQLTRSYLDKQGYRQYEVSNFAKPGRESRHNSTYWLNEEYYGLGAGAHGYMNRVRHANLKGIRAYIEKVENGTRPVAEQYTVDRTEEMENFMILGLRLLDGVSRTRFQSLYGTTVEETFGPALSRLLEQGLIQKKGDRIALTEKGLIFGNEVFASFL